MAKQPRAEATRQCIMDAAVELFDEVGYGETSLTAIIKRAKVTKGAFYYHFPDKEAVAGAIIDEGGARVQEATRRITDSPSAALEKLIRASFAIAELSTNDAMVRSGYRLRQGLYQISSAGSRSFIERMEHYVQAAHDAVSEGDVCGDIDPGELFEALHTMNLGCHLLSEALGHHVFGHLARGWRLMLRAIVPPDKLPYFQEFVSRLARPYIPTG